VTTGGVNYLADQYFSGGTTFTAASPIGATTDDVVYQTERYGSSFSYAVPLANGSYSVKLQFAELYHGAAGQRVFDVSAEGALVLDNLDIFAQAGGKFIAKDFVIPVSVTDGVLNLQFAASVDMAKIDAIVVTPASTTQASAASAGALASPGALTVTQSGGSTAVTEGGASDTVTLALSRQPMADVTVTAAGGPDLGAQPATLTFTTVNWDQPQTVTVSAFNDTLAEGAETDSVTFVTTSNDPSFDALIVPPLAVAVTDNDWLT
ncbi:malectin, partial [Phenylobacterium sp.]|uniref:malectin n=1 Tax=Phenylobacterium sp. TaxID=1871053 RepID=UPI00281155E1